MGRLSAILVVALIVFMIAPTNFDYERGVTVGVTQSGIAGPLLLSGMLALGLVICGQRMAALRAVLRELNPFLLGFVALASASVLWSADQGVTIRRIYRLYAMLAGCAGFVLAGWYWTRFQDNLRALFTFVTAGSVVFTLVFPEYGLERSEFGDYVARELVGAWRGLTMHKNTLGSVSAIACILWVQRLAARRGSRALAVGGLAAALVCLVASRSSTSIFSAVFAVGFMLLVQRPPAPALRRYYPYITGILATLLLVYSLGVLDLVPGLGSLLQPIVSLAGKDMTFSGRATIWQILKEEIDRHPWLGIGYGAYWTGPVPESASYVFTYRMFFYPGEGHNGYIDVINELGLVGGAMLVAYLVVFLQQALRLFRVDRDQGALYLALLFQELVGNLSEAHWWSVASGSFFLMTLITFCMARELAEARRAAAAAAARRAKGAPGP